MFRNFLRFNQFDERQIQFVRTIFVNAAEFCHRFRLPDLKRGAFVVRHSLPYSDVSSLSPGELAAYLKTGEPLEFGHSLDDQIGGQIEAGFVINGFYEDRWPGHALDKYAPAFMATRAMKS